MKVETYIPKRFIDLTINSLVYKVNVNSNPLDTKDQYGNIQTTELVEEIKIENIALKGGELTINEKKGYNQNYVLIDPKELDAYSSIHTVSKYKDLFYFSDEKLVKKFISDIVCKKIFSIEKSIPETIKNKQNEIKALRIKYNDFLTIES